MNLPSKALKNTVEFYKFYTQNTMREIMKKLLLSSLLVITALQASEQPSEQPTDPTQKYRDVKAHEAIIHDAYYEAQKCTGELPAAWKEALNAFGFKEGDINFYTALRTNKFVERAGNNLIILRPNFSLYLTPEEQKAYIGLQLASLKQGVEFDVGGSHGTFYKPRITGFHKATVALTALGLVALYRNQIIEKSMQWGPSLKNILFSKGGALVAGCFAVNEANRLLGMRDELKKLSEAQFEVIDKLGAEGLLSIRKKQVHWGYKNSSWLVNKWYYLLGKLSLAYAPEADLELINEHIEKKKSAQ